MLYKAYYTNIIVLDYKNRCFLLKTTFFSEIIPLNIFEWQILKITCRAKKMFLLSLASLKRGRIHLPLF